MFDLVGIGNAIVDTDVEIDEVFLENESLPKGQMTLIDSNRMAELVRRLGSRAMRRRSGGSAANTIYAAQAFGLTTSYVCQLGDDERTSLLQRNAERGHRHIANFCAGRSKVRAVSGVGDS